MEGNDVMLYVLESTELNGKAQNCETSHKKYGTFYVLYSK